LGGVPEFDQASALQGGAAMKRSRQMELFPAPRCAVCGGAVLTDDLGRAKRHTVVRRRRVADGGLLIVGPMDCLGSGLVARVLMPGSVTPGISLTGETS
jgi:hypothetical protein